MIFKVLTLFPDFFHSPLQSGLLGKAIETEIITVDCIDIRSFTDDKHKRCDDYPYGGGSGMVLKAEPVTKALQSNITADTKTILTTPSGKLLDQELVKKLTLERELCLICGHYEGIDQRIIDKEVDYEISIGDYIVSGGEFAALVIIDAIARYIPGFMGNIESLKEESFENNLLEYPHYTRPSSFGSMNVPEILTSGDHGAIEQWRLEKSIEKTKRVRPDLYKKFIMRKLKGE